jgi:hypothetical protein
MAKIVAASNADSLLADTEGGAAISVDVTVTPLLVDGGTERPVWATNLSRKRKIKPTRGAESPLSAPVWFGTWFANS